MIEATKEITVLVSNEEINIAISDVPDFNSFQISNCHIDATTHGLSEQYDIILDQATLILKKTTYNLLPSTVIMLVRRYHMDRFFTRNKCDTINGI